MTNDENKKSEVEILETKRLSDGFVKLDCVTAKIPTVDNKHMEIVREVHDHGNAVTVLPVDKQRGKVLMVSQWRIPAWIKGHKERIWEAPAGLLENNETPEQCAYREALEETGYKISNLRLICTPFASPGLVTEKVYIYLADYNETSKVTSKLGAEGEGEDIKLLECDIQELFEMLSKGKLYDAVTIIALYALKEEMKTQHR